MACYILHSTFSLFILYINEPKCSLILLLQQLYKIPYWHALRLLLEINAINIKGRLVAFQEGGQPNTTPPCIKWLYKSQASPNAKVPTLLREASPLEWFVLQFVMEAKMHARLQGHDENKYLYVNTSCLLQTHKTLYYNHSEYCFKYDGLKYGVKIDSTIWCNKAIKSRAKMLYHKVSLWFSWTFFT